MKILLCSYGSPAFQYSLDLQRKIALRLGFDEVLHFSRGDLDPDFEQRNFETLNFSRGAGYWVWKPQIIEQSLRKMSEFDILLYLDAGVVPKKSADFYAKLASDGLIHLWQTDRDFSENRHWVDVNVAEKLGICSTSLNSAHYMGGVVCSQVNENLRQTIALWKKLCEVPELLRPDSFQGYKPEGELRWHRHDQSILNLIVLENRELFCLHNIGDLVHRFHDLFVWHRRGALKTEMSLKLFLGARIIKRLIYCFVPRDIRSKINKRLTSKRKPYVTNEEWHRLG